MCPAIARDAPPQKELGTTPLTPSRALSREHKQARLLFSAPGRGSLEISIHFLYYQYVNNFLK